MKLSLINQGYDIIQGTTIGGLLYNNQYNHNGTYNSKTMPIVFY